jgi:thiamine-monophosphate kinase
MTQPTVADLGELGLLQRLQKFCPPDLLGDDAAVLAPLVDAPVITTDVLVEGVHFSDRTTAPQDVGWRSVAANLSDLAAMGAAPLGITVGLGLPGHTSVTWVEEVYQGMDACLKTFGGKILGGDIVRAQQVVVSITAIGQVRPERVLRRGRAQPGDLILTTGCHGASRAGLELLMQPESVCGLDDLDRAFFIRAHQRPIPRLDILTALAQLTDTECGRLAGMDSSDGLANAVLYLCRASGVGARLMRSHLPLPPAFTSWLPETTALDWCLYGGEDFELVLCAPPDLALDLLSYLGEQATLVGTVESEPTVLLVDTADSSDSQVLTWDSCFQHF